MGFSPHPDVMESILGFETDSFGCLRTSRFTSSVAAKEFIFLHFARKTFNPWAWTQNRFSKRSLRRATGRRHFQHDPEFA
jgi:hypothetical protein